MKIYPPLLGVKYIIPIPFSQQPCGGGIPNPSVNTRELEPRIITQAINLKSKPRSCPEARQFPTGQPL